MCQRQGVVPDGSHGQRGKFDLTDLRKVTKERAKEMAIRHAVPDSESRAKDPGLNINEACHDLSAVIREQIPKEDGN